MTLKLTDIEAQHFTGWVEAVEAARKHLNVKIDNLETQLSAGSRDCDGEEDREDIGLFHSEIEELGFNIEDAICDWQSRLSRSKLASISKLSRLLPPPNRRT